MKYLWSEALKFAIQHILKIVPPGIRIDNYGYMKYIQK